MFEVVSMIDSSNMGILKGYSLCKNGGDAVEILWELNLRWESCGSS